MTKNKLFILLTAIFVPVVTFIFLLVVQRQEVEATQGPYENETVCFCHNLSNNPHTICTSNNALKVGHSLHVAQGNDSFGECQVVPTVTPTQTPTPTPTVEIDPCEAEEKFTEAYLYDFDPCPTPTPTPEVKVDAGSDGRSDGRSTGGGYVAPQCNGIAPKAPIATGGYRIDSDTVVVRWHRSTDPVNHYVLVYGMSPDNLEWGVPYIPNHMDHYELNGVPQDHVWYRVTAEADNFCTAHSEVTDP